jgi:iron(III) transport system ATP-binding protein|tara:strand:+ start:458 stop:1078 length:621 start_codon:yes stop_codon:yes gene_type:complete
MLLEIKGLNFNYPDKEIFQSFDLKAPPGKILHLNGPSGAGKTTLLHLIAGIQSPQSGAITLGEEVFYDNKQKLLIEERRVGLVFQDYALFPHLNVLKNISFGNKSITEEKINKALHQLDINELKNKYPEEISGGQQQRVAIARTVLHQPNILMCDEPFSALDSKVLENTKDFIKSYVIKNQIPCLVVSHNNEAVGDNFFDEEIVIG